MHFLGPEIIVLLCVLAMLVVLQTTGRYDADRTDRTTERFKHFLVLEPMHVLALLFRFVHPT